MPLKNEGIAVSHDSVVSLLMQLSWCPTGENGVNMHFEAASNRVYYTKEEAEQLHLRIVEDQIQQITNNKNGSETGSNWHKSEDDDEGNSSLEEWSNSDDDIDNANDYVEQPDVEMKDV